MKTQLILFSVCHKKVESIPADRTVIGVGPNGSAIGAACTDCTGDNISQKNSSYCELTALYWIWKNVSCDYVGLEHYRRFFFTKGQLIARPMGADEIARIVESGKVILPKPHKCGCTVYEDYAANHDIADLETCRNIIAEDYPEYLGDFDGVMSGTQYSLANMFVMPKTMLDEYCAWLFDILFKAEKHIDILTKDAYQTRVFGFLAERLFNVWLRHKNPDIFYAPVYNIGDCPIVVRIKGKLSSNSNKAKIKR